MASAIHTVTVYIDGDLRRMRLNYGARLHGITAMLCYSGRRNLVWGLVSLISSPCMARVSGLSVDLWRVANATPSLRLPSPPAAQRCRQNGVRLLLIGKIS